LQLKSAFFALIVVGIVVTAVGVIINGWNETYNSGLVSDLGDYDQMSSVSAEAGTQQGKLSPNDPDPGTDAESSTFRGVYGVISNIYAPFRVVFGNNGMIDSVTERFGLPDYLRQGIVTMIVIAFTFTLVAIIFRLARGSA